MYVCVCVSVRLQCKIVFLAVGLHFWSRSSKVSVLKELSYTNEKIYARLLMAACESGKLETKRRLDSELW